VDDGFFAEFDSLERLQRALERLRDHGYRALDAFTPFPVEAIDSMLGARPRAVTRIGGLAAAAGIAVGYGLQWWLNAVVYPLDVGGRPPHSPLAFVPITFETAVLFCGIATFAAVLGLSGLPRLWRPAFEIEGFERASLDRFWLFVAADDRCFEPRRTHELLLGLGSLRIATIGVHAP